MEEGTVPPCCVKNEPSSKVSRKSLSVVKRAEGWRGLVGYASMMVIVTRTRSRSRKTRFRSLYSPAGKGKSLAGNSWARSS